MNVNSISRKTMPIVASTLIGLGALTSCSSVKNNNEERDYVGATVRNTEKTLDSLRTLKDNNLIDPIDYYVKSHDVINNIKAIELTNTDKYKKSNALGLISIITLCTGVYATIRKGYVSLDKVSKITTAVGALMLMGTGLIKSSLNNHINNEVNPKIEEYKEIKNEEWLIDKNIFLNNQQGL